MTSSHLLLPVDPLYTGFKPLADDHTISADELVAARAKYFREGATIGTSLIQVRDALCLRSVAPRLSFHLPLPRVFAAPELHRRPAAVLCGQA